MTTFYFTCGTCGQRTQHEGALDNCPACGKQLPKRDWSKSTSTRERRAGGGGWPIYSDAVAVHPDQVDEARRAARHLGVPTNFRPTGEPEFRSRAHRKKYCRAFGYFDRNGGYGDP